MRRSAPRSCPNSSATPKIGSISHKGYENVAAHRAAVTFAFTSPIMKAALARRKIVLISYADLGVEAVRP